MYLQLIKERKYWRVFRKYDKRSIKENRRTLTKILIIYLYL